LEHANGDYVFFTDGDCLVDERFTFHEESMNSGKDRVLLGMNASDVRVSIYTYPSFYEQYLLQLDHDSICISN